MDDILDEAENIDDSIERYEYLSGKEDELMNLVMEVQRERKKLESDREQEIIDRFLDRLTVVNIKNIKDNMIEFTVQDDSHNVLSSMDNFRNVRVPTDYGVCVEKNFGVRVSIIHNENTQRSLIQCVQDFLKKQNVRVQDSGFLDEFIDEKESKIEFARKLKEVL